MTKVGALLPEVTCGGHRHPFTELPSTVPADRHDTQPDKQPGTEQVCAPRAEGQPGCSAGRSCSVSDDLSRAGGAAASALFGQPRAGGALIIRGVNRVRVRPLPGRPGTAVQREMATGRRGGGGAKQTPVIRTPRP